MVKNLPAVQEICIKSLAQEDSPGEGNGYPPQHSYLGNPMNRGAWCPMVHAFTKNQNEVLFFSSVSECQGQPEYQTVVGGHLKHFTSLALMKVLFEMTLTKYGRLKGKG